MKQLFVGGRDATSASCVALGVAGVGLAAYYLSNPKRVAGGNERVDWRAEVAVALALVFVAVAAYVLYAG